MYISSVVNENILGSCLKHITYHILNEIRYQFKILGRKIIREGD